jgi:hypothetical protein
MKSEFPRIANRLLLNQDLLSYSKLVITCSRRCVYWVEGAINKAGQDHSFPIVRTSKRPRVACKRVPVLFEIAWRPSDWSA